MTIFVMAYLVITSGRISFVCSELADAVLMADYLYEEFNQKAAVVDTQSHKVVYETAGTVPETGD